MFNNFNNCILIVTVCVVVLRPFWAEIIQHEPTNITANFSLTIK